MPGNCETAGKHGRANRNGTLTALLATCDAWSSLRRTRNTVTVPMKVDLMKPTNEQTDLNSPSQVSQVPHQHTAGEIAHDALVVGGRTLGIAGWIALTATIGVISLVALVLLVPTLFVGSLLAVGGTAELTGDGVEAVVHEVEGVPAGHSVPHHQKEAVKHAAAGNHHSAGHSKTSSHSEAVHAKTSKPAGVPATNPGQKPDAAATATSTAASATTPAVSVPAIPDPTDGPAPAAVPPVTSPQKPIVNPTK